MTNENLEHRTKIRLDNIEDLMVDAENLIKYGDTLAISLKQNRALYEQNKIIIDYLQEIYKTQKGEQK